MTCVKLILPPRARRRWLLITMRLSAISLAGTARTLVAVGTVSEASMLVTTRAAAPRILVTSSPPMSFDAAGTAADGGAGLTAAGAGAGSAAGAVVGAVATTGWTGRLAAGSGVAATGAGSSAMTGSSSGCEGRSLVLGVPSAR